ncbi:PREDICTED: prenylcysteine oxidase-like [Vollenhovia emeryi]|uniref:prenylcysteine oxidase-like n=1 Tax=Vollenhovia emeryi TaxID=411798 RepID=UPI0005F36295|nr:PREDICTED: prenylcysteine oxidase-like [Vollenhovia emeryi]XP_011865641.1 PREDICTED: prenylcysteine oxidase-like [Vollenhovia emeryi]
MGWHVALLVLGGLTLQRAGAVSQAPVPRIAVIGGGIGGGSASHFLTELFNGTMKIDLYEARTVGGRLATVNIGGVEVEAGGSILHTKNMYMQRFVELLGLEKNTPSNDKVGIWNGSEFVFIESDWWLVTISKLLRRYGFQLIQLNWRIENMIKEFVKIYDLQDAGKSFASATELLSAMNEDFPRLLRISMREYLSNLGYSKVLIDELVQAATVVNYGQEVTDMQSFVGCICLATGSELWSVKGGNKKVPEHLIYRNKNVSVIPSRVTKIRHLNDNARNLSQYEVTYVNEDSTDPMTSTYDIVVIAAPLTTDQEFQIEFAEFPDKLAFPGSYQTTHVAFIKGDLNLKYFGLDTALSSILSCNPNKTKISSVGEQDSVDGSIKSEQANFIEKDRPVWKLFSRERMETSLLHDIFYNVVETKQIAWKAYPHYSTSMNLDNFKLHDALYHVNAIEWAASAMEMSAIAGRNVAILAYNDFLQKYASTLGENVAHNSTRTVRSFAEL